MEIFIILTGLLTIITATNNMGIMVYRGREYAGFIEPERNDKLLYQLRDRNCPNCGAPLSYHEGDSVAYCEYCSSKISAEVINA